MSYTKRQFVEAAFEELGLAAYVYDMQPDALQSGVRRLDAMMAQWNAAGIRLGYPLPGSPQDTDIDAETGVMDGSNEAIITGLAVRIAPSFGKIVAQDTKVTAKRAYMTLQARAAAPREQQFPGNLPSGAGNKPWRTETPFFPEPVSPVMAGDDGPIEWS